MFHNLVYAITMAALVGACAEQQVISNAESIASNTSKFETDLVIENLSKYIDDLYTIPSMGHFKSGTAQVQNSIGINLKVPYGRGRNGANFVTGQNEFDVNPASYVDQDVVGWDPIVDVDDVSRLKCLYTYAIRQSLGMTMSFADYQKNCPSTDALFRFLPPNHKWLGWGQPSDSNAVVCEDSGKLRSYNAGNGRVIYVCPKEFGEFVVAILGATPNTSGGTKLKTITTTETTHTVAPPGGQPTTTKKTIQRVQPTFQAPLNGPAAFPPPIIPPQ